MLAKISRYTGINQNVSHMCTAPITTTMTMHEQCVSVHNWFYVVCSNISHWMLLRTKSLNLNNTHWNGGGNDGFDSWLITSNK